MSMFYKWTCNPSRPFKSSKHNMINKNKTIQHKHCPLKSNNEKHNNIIIINNHSNNHIIDDVVINYWQKKFQLTKNDKNIFFNPIGWLNNQHLVAAMHMLYIQKLQSLCYQQHTYAIIKTTNRYLNNCLQHVFINNNHWILIKMHASSPNMHCTIYDSNALMMKKLSHDTIWLSTNVINVKHLLYKYANVVQPRRFIMWPFHNNIWG
jgi:hypothetical protein